MLRFLLSNQRFWAVVVLSGGVFLSTQFRIYQRPNAELDARGVSSQVEGFADGRDEHESPELPHANGPNDGPEAGGAGGLEAEFSSRSRLYSAATHGSIILRSAPPTPSEPIYYPPTLQEGLGQANLEPSIPREFPESLSSIMPIRRPARDAEPSGSATAEPPQKEHKSPNWPDEDFEKKIPRGRNLLDPRSTDCKAPSYLEQHELRGGSGLAVSHGTPGSHAQKSIRSPISSPSPQISGPNAHIIRQPNR